MKNFLTEEERDFLRRQHKRERDKRICDRIKAVLLSDKGWTLMQISEALLLTDEAVRQHILEYKSSRKLQTNNGGSSEALSKEQSDHLERQLQKHIYLYVKDIVLYISSTYGVVYTISGMCSWLRRHGFSYKKPALVPGKANIEQQKQWIKEYQQLKQNIGVDETICFIDGVHPTHNTQTAYGWIKKGVRKELPSNTGRSRLNLSGALDIISKKVLIQEDITLNTISTLSFLKKLEDSYPTQNTIHVFCDNARYYRNKTVTSYLETSKIKLHFLPPYSPNLNPIERLWKLMKERVMYNTYYEYFDDFKLAVMVFLRLLSNFDRQSALGQAFASRVSDVFHPVGNINSNS